MFDQILSVLFPERCCLCGTHGTAFCQACLATIPHSLPIDEAIPSYALFEYGNQTVRQVIQALKYHRKSTAAKSLICYGASHISGFLNETIPGIDTLPIILVPVPQYRQKKWQRGFNQSLLIATWLRPTIPQATIAEVLIKMRATSDQAKTHTRTERMENLHDCMRATQKLDSDALYIIIDDVITTGSTVHEASRALRAAGAQHIYAIAVAHGYKK